MDFSYDPSAAPLPEDLAKLKSNLEDITRRGAGRHLNGKGVPLLRKLATKYCRVCDSVFDEQMVEKGQLPKEFTCPGCLDHIENNCLAIRCRSSDKVIWVRRDGREDLAELPDVSIVSKEEFDAIEKRISQAGKPARQD